MDGKSLVTTTLGVALGIIIVKPLDKLITFAAKKATRAIKVNSEKVKAAVEAKKQAKAEAAAPPDKNPAKKSKKTE